VLRAILPKPISAALRRVRELTPRERATFQLLGLGYDNRTISKTLEISERTAKRHVTAILRKLRLESRLQAGLTALAASPGAAVSATWPEGRMDLASKDQ
jgi:DNA-binding NarL/FixJ family response regulator